MLYFAVQCWQVMIYDDIIVGAGSAGCVLANRLSQQPTRKTLLLEAGGKDWHPYIHMPAGLSKLVHMQHLNWGYETEPEPHLGGRRLYWPRGKVLGGSSSINAMCYARGHRRDYDRWAALGNVGWSYADVLPYFLQAENQERGASEYHGSGGPLNVADLRHTNILSERFLSAAAELGYPLNDDFNGPSQRGFGYYQVTQKGGKRWSTAQAYLAPARARENLTVVTQAMVQRVLFDGKLACGVEYVVDGDLIRAEAGRVTLCGGAINSPQLLMLSGIGPADQLREHGIDVVSHRDEVGKNLQDHLDVCTLYESLRPVTYDHPNELAVGLQYLLFHRGIGTSNIAEAGGFVVSSHAADDWPDLQFHFVPAMLDDHGRNRLEGNGFTLHACALRPASRGHITLASADPQAAPRICANYLSAEEDLAPMIEAVKLSRQLLQAKSFDEFRGREVFPGDEAMDDAAISAFIRKKAETIYHPVGTCRMGSDQDSVVDPQLRVRGVEGLRVVDASIMPTLTSGNTNAPTVMIAEKAAAEMLSEGV